MQENVEELQALYTVLVEFFVNYSFQLIGALIIGLFGLWIATKAGQSVQKLCESKNLDVTLSKFIGGVCRIAVIVIVAILVLNNLGISITPFVAAIGAISLGAGLAVQGLLTNFSAGLSIILSRLFVVGDTITVQGVTGVVKEINLSFTMLVDEDEVEILIPNRHIIGEILHNSGSVKLVDATVGVAYHSDVDLVISVIKKVLEEQQVTEIKQPIIGIDEFADSSININYRYWVPTASFHKLRMRVNNEVFFALKSAEIQIPFPQREVKFVKE